MHAQAWNASQVGQSLGLSYHTVNRHRDYLEDAFLVRRLDKAADLIDDRRRILVSRVPRPVDGERQLSCSLPFFLRQGLDALLKK